MSETKQAKGGKARAEMLSPEEKKAIARKGALARWSKDVPRSTHEGDFMLADVQVSAAVLPNRQRIITQATFLRALGRSRSPKAGTGVFATVDGVPFFLQANVLKPFITEELIMSTTPLFFVDKGGKKSVGYDARILPNVADVYLKYRDSLLEDGSEIPDRYRKIFAACDALMRYLAKEGIVALVDRATGYIADLEREIVTRILEEWISDPLRPYVRTFPVSWFKQICRLKDIEFRPDMRLPRHVGRIVNNLVYDRLGYGIRQLLDERTPVGENGRRKNKKFQHLTEEQGIPQLLHLLGKQEGLMMGYADGDWKSFETRLNIVMPTYKRLPLFEQPLEPESLPATALALPASSESPSSEEVSQ
jgi:hypothetical protein